MANWTQPLHFIKPERKKCLYYNIICCIALIMCARAAVTTLKYAWHFERVFSAANLFNLSGKAYKKLTVKVSTSENDET